MKGVVAVLLLAVTAVVAEESCPSNWWAEEKLLAHEDCDKFYMCTYGQPVEKSCCCDLYFNIETGQCDWQWNVDCGDRNGPGEEPTPAEPETEPTTAEPIIVEPTTTEPSTPATNVTEEPTTLEPSSNSTAEPTTEPTTTNSTTTDPTTEPTTMNSTTTDPTTEPTTTNSTTTEPTTEPTTTNSTTTDPNTEPTTTNSSTTDPTTEPTTTNSTTAAPTTLKPSTPESGFLENGCPVDPHIHWLLPVEGDCNGFYYCVWGELVLRSCPPSLHFNKEIQVCDWPANANCTSSNSTTPTPTSPKPTTPELTTKLTTPASGFLPNGCPVDPNIHWLLPVEGDCNGFYYCVWGELVLRSCPPTLHFNKEIQVSSADWLLPVEGDCNGFYYCVWGELVLRACPATLHFNRNIQVCDWPSNAGCKTSLNKHDIGQYSQRIEFSQ